MAAACVLQFVAGESAGMAPHAASLKWEDIVAGGDVI